MSSRYFSTGQNTPHTKNCPIKNVAGTISPFLAYATSSLGPLDEDVFIVVIVRSAIVIPLVDHKRQPHLPLVIRSGLLHRKGVRVSLKRETGRERGGKLDIMNNAGTEHVGLSLTRQTLFAPSAKRRVFGESHGG